MPLELQDRSVPPRALVLSLAALLVPVLGALQVPEALGEYGALLWLLALVPGFLLAYHRGWRGVATSLAVGMATLSLTQAAALWLQRPIPDILLGVVVAYLAIALGLGWLAEKLHKDRGRVEDMAFTDILTRLPNRRHARLFLENEFAAAERGRHLSVVLFDLDHFKSYNDRHGHPAGDAALKAFADLLERTTRRMDLSGRFGGEEFISVLAGTDTEGGLVFAERIRSALSRTELDTGTTLTVSAGVATYHPSMRSPDELLAAADHALYQAKGEGRNCVRLFGHSIMDHALPSPDAAEGLAEALGDSTSEYPRASEDIGRSRPPLTLLPHQITGFGEGRHVLVVEDDSQVRSLVSNYLSREAFEVVEAEDVPSGLERLGQEFDVVITDLRLPGPPGTELVAAVKSRWPGTQVLVITGLQDAQVAADALNAGADQYLFKPFGMPDLRRHLVEALERRERHLAERVHPTDMDETTAQREQEVRAAVEEGARALARGVEARAPFARGHGRRTGRYALCLCEGFSDPSPDPDPDAMELACAVHDVGLLRVPGAILNKEGDLDPDELRRVRTHPSVGRRLLESLLDDASILSVVSWHHERWDGKGYPDGIQGQAIPLEARIVAVADALDAMTTTRPYRETRSWDDAVAEIRSQSGRQFDPEVVAALDAREAELRAIFEEELQSTDGHPG